MTQTQTQTPQKQNAFAALDKKVADGLAADKAATQPQPVIEQAPDQQIAQPQQQAQAEPQKQPAAATPAAKS